MRRVAWFAVVGLLIVSGAVLAVAQQGSTAQQDNTAQPANNDQPGVANPPSAPPADTAGDRYGNYAAPPGPAAPPSFATDAPPFSASSAPAALPGDRYAPASASAAPPLPSGLNTPPAFANPPSATMQPPTPAVDYTAAPFSNGPGDGPTSNLNSSASAPAVTGTGRPGVKQLEGPQTPSLVVEKIAPADVQVGKPALFTVHIRNVGGVTAHDVTVRDEVPQGTQLLSTKPRAERGSRGELVWQWGALKPGDELTATMELLPIAEGELGSVATVQCSMLASGRSIATRPELALDVTAPREVLVGDEVALQIKISNIGTGPATDVVLGDRVPPNLEHAAGGELEYEVGTLGPNESRTIELVMKAVKPGAAVNLLSVRGAGIAPAERSSSLQVVAPSLEIALEGSRRRFLDRPASYNVSVSNPGTAVAEAIELTAYLPPGMEFVEANNQGQYDRRTRTVHWLLEELPPQQKGSVTLTVLPTTAGAQPLRLAGAARRGLAVERPETIVVDGVAALSFEVSDTADPIGVGDETFYEIRVSNQGSKAAQNVQVTVLLPPEAKPLSAEAPVRFEVGGGQIRFLPLPQLGPKADTLYRIRVQAASAGDLRARVQLTSDDIRSPITKEESTHVVAD